MFLNADADEELARLAALPSLDVFTEMGRVIVRLSVRMLFGSFIDRSAYCQVCDNWPVMERLAFHPLTLIATRLPLGPPAEFQRKRAELFALISGALTKAFATKDTNDDSYLGMIVREHRNVRTVLSSRLLAARCGFIHENILYRTSRLNRETI